MREAQKIFSQNGAFYEPSFQIEKAEIKETRFKDTRDFYVIYLTWAIVFLLAWIGLKSTFISNILQD